MSLKCCSITFQSTEAYSILPHTFWAGQHLILTCIRFDMLIADLKKLLSVFRSRIYNFKCKIFINWLFLFLLATTAQSSLWDLEKHGGNPSFGFLWIPASEFAFLAAVEFWLSDHFLLNPTSTVVCHSVDYHHFCLFCVAPSHFPLGCREYLFYLPIFCPLTYKLLFIGKRDYFENCWYTCSSCLINNNNAEGTLFKSRNLNSKSDLVLEKWYFMYIKYEASKIH